MAKMSFYLLGYRSAYQRRPAPKPSPMERVKLMSEIVKFPSQYKTENRRKSNRNGDYEIDETKRIRIP